MYVCCPNFRVFIYMGSLLFNQFKKNATSFIHERYKDARLLLTDTTEAEMLAEEVTNNDEPCSPDARTMSRIAEASYNIDDYWRIVNVLHKRLYRVDWRYWRQSYKTLVLLDFLLSHGPEEFSAEFDEHIDAIEELGSFRYTDDNRIDWGQNMRKSSKRILELLKGGETLIQARLKAIDTSKEIQGFGNISISSPLPSLSSSSSSSSPSLSSSLLPDSPESSRSSVCVPDSATSLSSGGSNLAWSEADDNQVECDDPSPPSAGRRVVRESSSYSSEVEDEQRRGKGKGKHSNSFVDGLCSKLGISPKVNCRNG